MRGKGGKGEGHEDGGLGEVNKRQHQRGDRCNDKGKGVADCARGSRAKRQPQCADRSQREVKGAIGIGRHGGKEKRKKTNSAKAPTDGG